MSADTDFEFLREEVMEDREARAAYLENALRRKISSILAEKGMSSVRQLVEAGVSATQARRLLGEEAGGSLSLLTICKALIIIADDSTVAVCAKSGGWGVEVDIEVNP